MPENKDLPFSKSLFIRYLRRSRIIFFILKKMYEENFRDDVLVLFDALYESNSGSYLNALEQTHVTIGIFVFWKYCESPYGVFYHGPSFPDRLFDPF